MLPANLEQTTNDASVSSLGKKQNSEPSSNSINSGMSVTSQVPNPIARPVDSKTVQGSYPGDHRFGGDSVKPSMDKIANPPGPRGETESKGA